MKTTKAHRIKPKRVWAFRLNESMLALLTRLAAEKEMRPSEYVRRILENHLAVERGGHKFDEE